MKKILPQLYDFPYKKGRQDKHTGSLTVIFKIQLITL